MGHACVDARFNAQGLCLFWREDGGKTSIYNSELEVWGAVEAFFDPDFEDTHRLFAPDSYTAAETTTPAAVRQRIEPLLACRDIE